MAYARTAFSTRTVDLYTRALTHLQTLAGDVALSSLPAQRVDLYKGRRLASISPVSVNMELRALKAAFSTAARWKLIEASPFLNLQAVSVPEVPPSYLTKADFQKLTTVISEGWLHDLVVFAVSTGVRQVEMLNLRWQDVDLERRLITIQSSQTFRTKAGKWRVLPMNDVVAALLHRRAERAAAGFVFTRRGRPIGKSYLQHRFKRFVREAGLDDRLHWHSLRHTHATWLVQAGATLYEVQRLLGHSSPRVTEIYSHLLPEHLHRTVNRIKLPLN